MSDSNKRNSIDEEKKKVLIAKAKEIKSWAEVLIEDIKEDRRIIAPSFRILQLCFSLDHFTERKFTAISEMFRKHIL